MQGVTSGAEALTLVTNTYFDLAILDAESSDLPFVPFTRDLVERQPGLKLLVFPPQNNPHHPALTGLVANGYLKKPFFTPEVSRALKDIFNDKIEAVPVNPEPTNNLAELWIKRPEVGMNRVEQLLGSTTAQTGLLIAGEKVIAASGLVDDANIQQVMSLLAAHKADRDSLDLLHFMTLEAEEREILMYASQLIPQITLVLFYPATAPIQLVRQEVYQVKQEFKEAYPTTGELRKELDVKPEVHPPAQPTSSPESESTASAEELNLKPLEEEIGPEDLDTVLSAVELKNLDNLLAEMPAPDPDLGDEPEAEAVLPTDNLDLSNWLPLPESDDLAGSSAEVPPPLPHEPGPAPEPEFADLANSTLYPFAMQDESSAADEKMADSTLDLPWEKQEDLTENTAENESHFEPLRENQADETVAEQMPEAAKTEDASFNTWLDELQSFGSEQTKELSPEIEEPGTPIHTGDVTAVPPPLPSAMFTEESGQENPEFVSLPESDEATKDTATAGFFDEELPPPQDSVDFPLEFSADPASTVAPPELSPEMAALRDFRFNYTCLLIPRDPHCFLARDLGERLSFLLPQLHLEYGWHISGIAVRPQYLLWAIALPMDACPVDIIQEIRRRTSAHLLANFPNLKSSDPQLDFWAPGFLALSGSSIPSVEMIYDFIKQTRANQKSKH